MSFRDLMETKADRPKVREPLYTKHGNWLVCWSRNKYTPFSLKREQAFGDLECKK